MDNNDSQAIGGLFSKLAQVEQQSPPRDAEAEAFIREKVAGQPGAPYYMAQTIIVQEQALNAAQARIEELESQAERGSSGGGLLGSLFGGGQSGRGRGSVPRAGQTRSYEAPQGRNGAPGASPWGGRSGGMGGMGGGGFLAGAAQTAMGVAGGVLLGNAIAGMFDGGEANAAEAGAEDAGAQDAGVEDAAADDGGFDGGDMGGDMDI